MKIMTSLFINLALLFSACGSIKNDTLPQSIKEIWVYDYFDLRGYTTAGAYGKMIRLEEEGVSKFKLEKNDTDSLCRILQETLPGKLFHTKLGVELILGEIVLINGQKLKIIIASNVISVDVLKKNYWVKDERNLEWLDGFRNRIRNEHNREQLE
jgi:hypothetical protein